MDMAMGNIILQLIIEVMLVLKAGTVGYHSIIGYQQL